MNYKRIGYIVFLFILCTIFSSEVKALVADQESGVANGSTTEMSCAYWDEDNAYKLVQDNSGILHLYKVAWGSVDTVVVDDNVSWSGPWSDELKRNIYLYKEFVQNPVQGADINGETRTNSLSKCPNVLIAGEDKLGMAFISDRDDINIDNVNKTGYKFFSLKASDNKAYITNSQKLDNASSKKYNKVCDEIGIEEMWIDSQSKDKAHASCLYSYDLKNDDGCMVLQLDIDQSGAVSSLVGLPSNLGGFSAYGSTEAFNDYYIRNQYDGNCPSVYVNTKNQKGDFYYSLAFDIPDKKTWFSMQNRAYVGKNLNDPTLDISGYEYKGFEFGFIDMTGLTFSCSELLDEDGDLVELLHMLLVMVKIIVPIIIIVLGSLDFASAMFAGDESNMKKAQAKFIKRLVIGVAIFLVPSILKLLLNIGHSVWPVIDADLCGIL